LARMKFSTAGEREGNLAKGPPRVTASLRTSGRIKFVKSRREFKNLSR
jgi:hypothetical protein